jgi:hypothetical protein
MTFNDLCNKHGTDKGNTIRECHGYSFTYEKLFEPYRDKQLNILEIGIADPLFPGASLKVLSEYFPKANIIGFDIVDCSHFNIERTVILRGDASSKEDVLNILNTQSEFDIIIDDGSHLHDHHMNCFFNLFSSVKKGGLYIIEDLHAPTSEKTTEYFYSETNEPVIKSYGVKRIELYNNRKLLALYNEKIK